MIGGVEPAQLRPIDVRGRTPSVGRAIEVGVVQQHGHTVARDVDVALEHERSLAQRGVEGEQRVLRTIPGRTATCPALIAKSSILA